MVSRTFVRLAGIFALCLAVSATASAQQYGGGGGTGTGGTGTGANGATAPNYSYGPSTGAKVGIGVGAAAGVAAVVLLIRHHHKTEASNQASLTGCTQSVLNSLSLTDEAENQTYTLLTSGTSLKPGERVELSGSKASTDAENPAFRVRGVVKDFGACNAAPANNSSVASLQPVPRPAASR